MPDIKSEKPESTAARVALWRALHVMADPPPHVFEDLVGLKLVDPDESWRSRPDMNLQNTKLFRASIISRARFIEDLVEEQAGKGVDQYVILGAGLDSFAQRKPEIAANLKIFEIDQPGPQAWKRKRLIELGFGIPEWLRLVPVDFESGQSWRNELSAFGFKDDKPAVIVSTGVSMYLTRETNLDTLRQIALLAPGSTLAMTFLQPIEYADSEERIGFEFAIKGAAASGTPFISFFTRQEMTALALEAGFKEARCVSGDILSKRYFSDRTDGLHPGNSEPLLIATT